MARNEIRCSFCGKTESQVMKLLKGPNGVYICDACVELCSEIIEEEMNDEEDGTDAEEINLLKPEEIKAFLDDYVIGQEKAKKVLSVAVYNHYKRILAQQDLDVELQKSNILLLGPTGSGKTLLAQTLAKILNVPFAIADATTLTEAGYVGEDVENILLKIIQAADYDIERAQKGIIYIDEIDKIAKKKTSSQRDVSGESVQQGMLKLLEGSEVEVPVGANSKNAMVPLTTVNTKNILFICGGAFPDLENIIKERLNKQSSIGFRADLKDKYDHEKNLIRKVTVEDLRNFGMIPEFLGRLPIIYTLDGLSEEMMVRILKEPKNSLVKQYEKLFELDGVKLEFDESAINAIAEKSMTRKTGARGLRAIMENTMMDLMYEIPSDETIRSCKITKEVVEGTGSAELEHGEMQPPTRRSKGGRKRNKPETA